MNAVRASDSARRQNHIAACSKCGSTSRVGRNLCLTCLLQRGLDPDIESAETLDAVLDEVDVRDAEWRLGNYQILEEIGRGGMGVIYRARQRHSRRIVAVKRILGYHADSRETLARFRREVQAAASLDHPNILPIYEVGESESGLPFFSMKFAPGGSLQDAGHALRNEPRQCVALVAKVTRAVQYAHSQGILHRDLKPGNILLDGRGEPFVSDFGLAKWLETTSDLTRTLTIFGTPGYIAPEQANGLATPLEPAADVYSLGAILFDLVAGRPPFLGSHALSVIRQASESQAPKLRSFSKLAGRDLETICARCLEREPPARYHSAQHLAEDLERWLAGQPIIARPLSPPVRVWRWSKRNPILATSFAAIALLGAAGLTATIASSRLSSIVQRAEIAQHSVVITPFEDLDEISTASNSAQSTTSAFTAALKAAKGIQTSSAPRQPTEERAGHWRPEDWKRIGEAAGARMVLSGSVRQREGKQRVALHLIETATGSVVSNWLQEVESYSDLATTVPARISRLLDDPKAGEVMVLGDTRNSLARSYYDRGNEFFFRYNLPDQVRAIDSFRQAIEIDSGYGQAHAMLATACQLRSLADPGGDWLAEGERAAENALRLAPMLPEAHSARAGNFRRRGLYREALDPSLTAYELNPSNSRAAAKLGIIYHLLGRADLALLWFEKAARRETQPVYEDNIAAAWTDLGDYEKAEKAYQTAVVFRPDLPVGALGLITLALFRGDSENARQQCEAARTKYKDNPQPLVMAALIEFFSRRFVEAERLYREALESNHAGGVEFVGSVRFLSALGFIRQNSGAETEGKTLLEEARALDEKELSLAPENPERLYSLAATQAALGNAESAKAALDKAIAAAWIDYRSIELDPRFDPLRQTAAFQEILNRLKENIQTMRGRVPARLQGAAFSRPPS